MTSLIGSKSDKTEALPNFVVEFLSPSTKREDLPKGRKFACMEHYSTHLLDCAPATGLDRRL